MPRVGDAQRRNRPPQIPRAKPAPTRAVDPSVPNAARLWGHWLGSKDTYALDREVGDKVALVLPEIRLAARHSRAFLCRAVGYLAEEMRIRQFIDIGTGMPAADHTHEVAQRIAPDARVVYIDNDPLVISHARALLTSTLEGACDHIQADARDVDTILREAAVTLDFTRPIGLLLLNILNYLTDDEAHATVKGLVTALAPGSHLVIAHPTAELHGERFHGAMRLVMDMGGAPLVARTPSQISRFFDGLKLLEPGIVPCSHWRPGPWPPEPAVLQFCGVARVPDWAASR